MLAKYLNKVPTTANQVRLWEKMIMWYNTSINTYLQMILLYKVLLCDKVGQGEWHKI